MAEELHYLEIELAQELSLHELEGILTAIRGYFDNSFKNYRLEHNLLIIIVDTDAENILADLDQIKLDLEDLRIDYHDVVEVTAKGEIL